MKRVLLWAEPPHGNLAGRVTHEATAWCAFCNAHTGSTPSPATREWRALGWRRTRDSGWVCPSCRSRGRE